MVNKEHVRAARKISWEVLNAKKPLTMECIEEINDLLSAAEDFGAKDIYYAIDAIRNWMLDELNNMNENIDKKTSGERVQISRLNNAITYIEIVFAYFSDWGKE